MKLDDLVHLLDQLANPQGAFRSFLEAFGDLATMTALAGAAVFAISYRAFFNWQKTAAGRALSQFTLALTAVLGLVILARVFGPEYSFRWIIRDVVYTWCAVAMYRLVVVLWENWHRGDQRLLDIEPKPRKKEQA